MIHHDPHNPDERFIPNFPGSIISPTSDPEETSRKIRIVSGGASFNTEVLDAKTGQRIEGVTGVQVNIAYESLNTVTLTFENVELDITGTQGSTSE